MCVCGFFFAFKIAWLLQIRAVSEMQINEMRSQRQRVCTYAKGVFAFFRLFSAIYSSQYALREKLSQSFALIKIISRNKKKLYLIQEN